MAELLRAFQFPIQADVMKATPARAAQSWARLLRGEREQPSVRVLEVDPGRLGVDRVDGLVALRGLPFIALCDRHLLPYHGEICIAYQALRSETGLRLVDPESMAGFAAAHSRRLIGQEALGLALAAAFQKETQAGGVLVRIGALHTALLMQGGARAKLISEQALGTLRDVQMAERARRLLVE